MGQTFDPQSFLTLAEKIVQHSQDEAAYRAAVGRAYYAVFLIARVKMSLPSEQDKTHSAVLRRLADVKKFEIRNKLRKLQSLRVAADYYLAPPYVENNLSTDDQSSLADEDWGINWQDAFAIASHLMPEVVSLKTYNLPKNRH